MAIGDVYELVQSFNYLGQVALNVWHYVQKTGSLVNSAAELASGFNSTIKPLILDGMSDDCTYFELRTVNLMDPTEFNIFTTAENGTVPSIPASNAATFLAWSWRFEQAAPGGSVGSKRFTGVAEDLTNGNVYFLPGSTEADMKAALQDLLPGGTGANDYRLVVVKRPFSLTVPPTVWTDVAVVTYTNLTTQSSRKF